MQINKINKKVAIVMGSQTDYLVMKSCEEILKRLKIKFETKIVSAHRTPDRMFTFAKTAIKNNFAVIVAGAGGSAHLPGMIASMSTLPVLGVPIETKKLKGLDSLLSIVQMPKGIPVGTVAIGENGAFNAGLLAASIIALSDSQVRKNLEKWRRLQTASIKKKPK
jgi:5-(carboxyamino)imidazole ribonucleotide mutase